MTSLISEFEKLLNLYTVNIIVEVETESVLAFRYRS